MIEETADSGQDGVSLIKEADEIQQLISNELTRRYQERFGKPMDFLLTNCSVVSAFADHPDPEYRNLALCFLARHCVSSALTKDLLMRKAREDPCEGVRACAITNLATLQHLNGDKTIRHFLKRIVYDEGENIHLRKAAYFAITYFDREGNLMDYQSFSFPEQVDWRYLESIVPGEAHTQG
jgi:hypothetical protein